MNRQYGEIDSTWDYILSISQWCQWRNQCEVGQKRLCLIYKYIRYISALPVPNSMFSMPTQMGEIKEFKLDQATWAKLDSSTNTSAFICGIYMFTPKLNTHIFYTYTYTRLSLLRAAHALGYPYIPMFRMYIWIVIFLVEYTMCYMCDGARNASRTNNNKGCVEKRAIVPNSFWIMRSFWAKQSSIVLIWMQHLLPSDKQLMLRIYREGYCIVNIESIHSGSELKKFLIWSIGPKIWGSSESLMVNQYSGRSIIIVIVVSHFENRLFQSCIMLIYTRKNIH